MTKDHPLSPATLFARPRIRISPGEPMAPHGDYEPVSETLETVVRTSDGDKVIARVARAYVRRLNGGDFVGHACNARDAANLAAACNLADTERRENTRPMPAVAVDGDMDGTGALEPLPRQRDVLAWSPAQGSFVTVPGIMVDAYDGDARKIRHFLAAYSNAAQRDAVIQESAVRAARLQPAEETKPVVKRKKFLSPGSGRLG